MEVRSDGGGRPVLERWVLACASGSVYYILAATGLLYSTGPENVSPVWPAAGFGAAAVLLWGPSAAAGVFLGALLAPARPPAAETLPASAVAMALVGLGAAAQAALGAALLRRRGSPEAPPRGARDAAALCALAPVIALVGPAFELLALLAAGAPPDFRWTRAAGSWWLSDAVGILVVVPLALAWARPRERARKPPTAARAFEALSAASVLAASAAAAFVYRREPLLFASFPAVFWILFRFGSRAATAAVAALAASVAGLSAYGAIEGSLGVFSAYLAAIAATAVLARALLHEREAARQALQDRASLLQLMIDGARDCAIFRLDAQGRVAGWSKGAELLYGVPASEAVGSPLRRFLLPEADAEASERRLLSAAAGEGRAEEEAWGRRRDGSRFWADLALTALRDAQGAPLGHVAFVRDASARRKAQAEHEERIAALAESRAELAEFASAASHDLNAPLHKVKAFGERLEQRLEGLRDEEARDYLRRMSRAVDGMQRLIDGLLALSRVTTRGGPAQAVDLGALAREVVDGLGVEKAGAKVEIGALPRVEADPAQMRQLLQHLVSNAVKFQPRGGHPRVRISGRLLGAACELRVADNGIGLDMKYADRIFRPFQRLNSAFDYEGSGLGLATCRRILARHGGSIGVLSRPGRGAEFKVILPVQAGRLECQIPERASR